MQSTAAEMASDRNRNLSSIRGGRKAATDAGGLVELVVRR